MKDLAPTSSSALRKPIDPTSKWVKDFALIGGVTGALAPLAVVPGLIGTGYIAAAGVAGVISGAALGGVARRFLQRSGSTPLPVLLAGGVGMGAIWGGVVGAIAGIFTGDPFILWKMSAVFGAVAGAAQFGWLWLPYVLRQLGRRKTWPLVVASTLLAPALGWLGVLLFIVLGKIF